MLSASVRDIIASKLRTSFQVDFDVVGVCRAAYVEGYISRYDNAY